VLTDAHRWLTARGSIQNHWRAHMKALTRFFPIILLSTLFLTACSSRGSEFLGTWVNAQNPKDTFEITRNACEYLIVIRDQRIGAIYKDGAREVKGGLFSANLTYIKQSDTNVGPGSFASSSTGEGNDRTGCDRSLFT
jgi:hypothetical protein